MSFSFRQIQYFVAIAELGSLSNAAKTLNVTPSSITVGIRDLEADLSCRLFDRRARGMELTLKGERFLRYARQILTATAHARRSLDDDGAPMGGKLNLGVTPLVAGYVLAKVLARFRQAFPTATVSVIEDNREDLEDLLIGGECDAALVVLPNGERNPALQSSIIQTSPYRVWMAADQPLASKPEIAIAQLSDLPHVLLSTDEIGETAEKYYRRVGLRVPILVRTGAVEAVRGLVGSGAGIAVMPDLAYRRWSLEGDRVEARPLIDPPEPALVSIIWRRGTRQPPLVEGLLTATDSPKLLD